MNFQIVYCYGHFWFKQSFTYWNECQSYVKELQNNGYLVLGVNKRTSGNFI
jgi:hypothetical protein